MTLDPMYFLFMIPGLVLALIAQLVLKYNYSKYSKVSAGTNLTGNQAAQILNDRENFKVQLKQVSGTLTDHYNPMDESVHLSADNASNTSLANIAVVAHEFGHVQQKRVGQSVFRLRSFLVPAVNFGSGIGYLLIVLGLILSATGLAQLGLILFSTTFLFSLVTLPVEIDASKRGMALIKKHELIQPGNLGGAKWVLVGAALTYFAGMIQSLMQLLYFVMLVQGRDRD
jgi:Zn-dependent membrane protease YugP